MLHGYDVQPAIRRLIEGNMAAADQFRLLMDDTAPDQIGTRLCMLAAALRLDDDDEAIRGLVREGAGSE